MLHLNEHPNAQSRPTTFLAGGKTHRLPIRSACGIWLFGLSMLLPWLGSSRALTYHEVVFAEPAREMLRTGEFLVPRIAGVPFTDKPPLMAWCIATSMAVLQSEAEWVVRLPSVLAAIATAWWIATLAARWLGVQLGILSGLIHLTTVHVMMQARLAECDTLLGLTVAGAVGLFGMAFVDSPHGKLTGRWVQVAFYACAAGAFMTKFLAGPLFIVAGIGLFTLIEQRWRDVLRWLLEPFGIAVAFLLTVPWCVAAYLEYPALIDNVLYHNVGRFSGSLARHEPPWAYLYLVPFMMLPWAPWLIVGLVQGIRCGLHYDSRWRFLVSWSLGGLAILSLAAFKAKHYTVPALAPLAVIAAYGLSTHLQWRLRHAHRLTLISLVAILLGVGGSWWVIGQTSRISIDERGVIGSILILVAAGLTAVVLAEHWRSLRGQCLAGFATAWCVSLAVQQGVIPFHDSYRHQTEFADVINRHLQSLSMNTPLQLVGLPENQVTFYLQPPLLSEPDAHAFLRSAGQQSASSSYEILAPDWVADLLAAYGEVAIHERCLRLNRYQTDADRLTLLRWRGDATKLAQLPEQLHR